MRYLMIAGIVLVLVSLANAATITINNPVNGSTISPILSSVTLNLTTNETAECRYSTSIFQFSDGTTFTNTNSVDHTTSYSVSAGNTYSLYYICNSTGDENRTSHHIFYTASSSFSISSVTESTSNETANITIETSREANATIYYGTTEQSHYSSYGDSSSLETSSNEGTFYLTGLDDGTTYYYTIVAIDAYGINDTYNDSFTTDDSTAPTITITGNSTTSSTITISWTTDESSDCTLQYGTSTSYGNNETSSGTSHSETLTGLDADTAYYFKITCTDSSSNSQSTTFMISTDEDTTAPTITVAKPEGSVKDDDVSFYVTTNEDAKCYYSRSSYIYSDMTAVDSSYSTAHSWELLDQKNGKYTYHITCLDESSNNATTIVTFKVEKPVVDEVIYGVTTTTLNIIPEYDHFNMSLDNLSKPKSIHITKDYAIRDITIVPDEIYKNYELDVLKLLDLTEVTDLDNIIYEAYKILTAPSSTLEIYFDIPQSWIDDEKADENLISVFNFRENRWHEIIPKITSSGSGISRYMATGISPGYVVLGINSEKLLDYQLEKKKKEREAQGEDKAKANKEIKVHEKKNTVSRLKRASGISEPLDQDVLLADPSPLSRKSVASFAIAVLIVSLAGALTIAYSQFKGVKSVKDMEKELIKEAKGSMELLRDFYDEDIVGDGITPLKRKEEERLAEEFDKLMEERKSYDEVEIEEEIKEVEKNEKIMEEDMLINNDVEENLHETSIDIKKVKDEVETRIPKRMVKTLDILEKDSDKIDQYNNRLLDEIMAFEISKHKDADDPDIVRLSHQLEKKGYSKEEIDNAIKRGEELLKEHLRYDEAYIKLLKEAVIKMHKQGKSKEEIRGFLVSNHLDNGSIDKILNAIHK